MQISCTLPANLNNLSGFGIRCANFQCRGWSALNPSVVVASAAPVQGIKPITDGCSSKTHLSNLEKLLQTNQQQSICRNEPAPAADASAVISPAVLQEPPSSTTTTKGKGKKNFLLEGLSLAGIWPAGKKSPEEMSPRHLTRLQRILSKSQQEYSPRNHLGSKWQEYHGSNDWAGLLDPLDANLRRELIRYGEFIQAAYQAFHSDPTGETGSPQYYDVPLRDRSYKVTKSLYATSSIGLPGWIDEVAPDLGWMTQRSSWIGYVAVCDDEREIARMGRRDIVIALRGTSTCLEWAENMRDVLVPVPCAGALQAPSSGQPKVECGFSSLFRTAGQQVPSLAESVVGEVRRLMELYEGEALSISVTGHSLGAALALLVADEVSTCAAEVPPVAVFSFGGPRVGNRAFGKRIKANKVKVLRIVNAQDVITRVPGMFVSEELDQKLRGSGQSSHMAGVLDVLDNNMPWAYTHVGTELKVDTKMSPYLKPNADVACCHDLEAYLHLVDGFMASNSPFRANAKRSLIKLLSEQGANVKKLYMSRAKSSLMKANFDLEGAVPQMMRTTPSFNEYAR
ncbi:hypothetical protein Dimus_008978 [Dionaea muscipula]